jgi:hypothetical protein
MQDSKWYFNKPFDDDEDDAARPKTPEELTDQFGIRTALLVLCVAFFIAAMWVISRPSFERCSAMENATERHACYDKLREELLKPPTKGVQL